MKESFARELSRVLGAPLFGVQRALSGLELDGLVAGRRAGRTHLYRINPRYFARPELEAFLGRLAEAESGLAERIAGLRRRPRRSGKPV